MFGESPDNPKLKKDDRIIILKAIDDKAKNSSGILDPRLFTGENNLHVTRGKNNIWSMYYDKGVTPPALKQRFTSFREAVKYVEKYFTKRNIRIAEIIQ